MGILSFLQRKGQEGVFRLPSGCFTVDRNGAIISSTLSTSFPAAQLEQIARQVLETFRQAHKAQMVFQEIYFQYPALTLTARELRGGAIIFFTPVNSNSTSSTSTASAYAK